MAVSPSGVTPLLGVFDMVRSLAFYRDVLGFEVVSASPVVDTREGRFAHWMWLRLGAVDLMLNTQYDSDERPERPHPERVAAHRDTVLYLSFQDLDVAYRELTARGLVADPPHRAPYGLRVFNVTDPDGFTLVFQELPPR